MNREFRGRLVAYLLASVLLALAVWAIAWWSLQAHERQQLSESARQAERIAVFFERQTRSSVRYGDSYVKMVRREYTMSASLDAVRALMDAVPLDSALVSHITILDAGGTPIYNSGYALKAGRTAADRAYFKHQRDAQDDEIHVSLPRRGRNSDKLIVRLVRRMTWPDGRFAGVVFAALDAQNLIGFFDAMSLGPQSSATLVGRDKRIRARSSYGRLGPGQDISGSRIWRELDARAVGLYKQTSVVDGVTRNYAYRALSDFPLIVAVGVATDDVSLVSRQREFPTYLIATLATVLITLVMLLFVREVRATQRIRESESRVRAMRDELETRVAQRTTELGAVQDELLRKERLAVLGQLTGTVAHELRNPLGTITASLAIIERRLGVPSEEMRKPIERVRRNVARCNNIITELLDFTRARGVTREPTPVDAWLRELIEELRGSAHVPLELELGSAEVCALLDRDRARRAIVNLIDNASDAVRDDRDDGMGAVRIVSGLVDDGVEISVHDNGPGIPKELLEQVHEPLFSTKSFGVGLGLPIVARIMKEHDGRFTIDSDANGTVATLRFVRQG